MRARARPTTKADETPEFQAFWAIWRPHMNPNDGRGAARDEFLRHVELYGAEPQDIVDGAAWFIRSGGNQKRASDGGLIQSHASSWLNKRAYEDGCEQERAFQRRQAERQQRETATTNVTPIRQEDPIDNEARARHANALLARAGFRAAGE